MFIQKNQRRRELLINRKRMEAKTQNAFYDH